MNDAMQEQVNMKITVSNVPHILFETVELLYQYINKEYTFRPGEYCIPRAEHEMILAECCGDLDPNSEILHLFFKKQKLLDGSNQGTCLAFCMAYSLIDLRAATLDRQMESLQENWNTIRRKGYRIDGMSMFAFDIKAAPEAGRVQLATELRKLPLSDDFLCILIEVFADFDFYCKELLDLLRPVSRKLERCLIPYQQNAAALADTWRAFLAEGGLSDFLCNRSGMVVESPVKEGIIVLRYLSPYYACGKLFDETGVVHLHMGVGLEVSKQDSGNYGQDFIAVKLLGDKGRNDLIRLISGEALSLQEISRRLEMNPGTTFKNLNSLANAKLISREPHGDRYYYRARLEYIQSIFDRLMDYYKN